MKKYKIGYTTGVFDMFHIGHLNILKQAKEQCEYLIVGVTTDELCFSRKGKMPIITFKASCEIIDSIKYVDEVISQKDMDKFSVVKKYRCNAVFVGSDWKGTEAWAEYERQFATLGCDVVYLQYTEGISSTTLRNQLKGEKNDN